MNSKFEIRNGLENRVTTPFQKVWGAAYIQQIADQLERKVIPGWPDGFTFCARTRRCLFVEPTFDTELFVVSIADCGRAFQETPSIRDLADWISVQSPLLFELGYYIGGWWKEGIFFLDVSMLVVGFAAAIQMGEIHSQETVYHPASDRVIEVNHPVFGLHAAACAR